MFKIKLINLFEIEGKRGLSRVKKNVSSNLDDMKSIDYVISLLGHVESTGIS